jgi:hypothetical protein
MPYIGTVPISGPGGGAWEDDPAIVAYRDYASQQGICRRRLIDAGGADLTGYFYNGFREFFLRPAAPGALPPARDCEAALRQLVIQVERFDRDLAELRSGELMRTVVTTGREGVHCGRVRPDEYLTALRRGDAGAGEAGSVAQVVDRMDEQACYAVTDIRRHYGLDDEYPGGWENPLPPPLTRTASLTVYDDKPAGHAGDRMVALCEAALNVEDLQYVAFFTGSKLEFSADVLADPELAAQPWFTEPFGGWLTDTQARETQRDRYRRFGESLPKALAQVAHALRAMNCGTIESLVLDVQQGAIYVRVLTSPPGLALGVTLHQHAVRRADLRFRHLLSTAREFFAVRENR